METVEVLVRIPKDLYEGIECRNGELETEYVCDELMKAIDNGTPLPKGHRRLIDANDLSFRLNEAQIEGTDTYKGLGEAKQIVEDAPTILEADRKIE